MKLQDINWLGWVSLAVLVIIAITGIKIEVHHNFDRKTPFDWKAGYQADLKIEIEH